MMRRTWISVDFDYNDYVLQHREEALVVAVTYLRGGNFGNERQRQRKEESAVMQCLRSQE